MGRGDMSDLASKAGLVEGLASSPHHLRNEHSLFTPVIIYIQVGLQCSAVETLRMQNGCQIDLGQMSAPPHFGFGFGPPDPGAFDPGKAAKYYTRSTGQHTSHIGR